MSEENNLSIADSVTDDAFTAALNEPTPDVIKDTNDPAPSNESVVVATDDDPKETPPDEAPKGDEPAESPQVDESQETPVEEPKPAESLNWETAPETFREEYKARKEELAKLQQNSLQEKFLTDSDQFLDELNGLSTSQFQQTTQQIVKRGIDAAPEAFAEYLAEVKPEAVAKTLAKVSPEMLAKALDLGMPLDKAKKIIAQVKSQDLEQYLNDNETDETETVKPKATSKEAVTMSPEDIEKLVERRVAEAGKPQQVETLKQETYAEIMKPVEKLLQDAGLTPQPTDSPDDKQWKEWASQMVIKETFDHLLDDEKNAPRAKKMFEMFDSLDKSGVKNLATSAKIIAEDFAGARIEMLTNRRAEAKTKGTKTPKVPPKVVPSSGAVPTFGNPQSGGAGRISEISESEFESAGM